MTSFCSDPDAHLFLPHKIIIFRFAVVAVSPLPSFDCIIAFTLCTVWFISFTLYIPMWAAIHFGSAIKSIMNMQYDHFVVVGRCRHRHRVIYNQINPIISKLLHFKLYNSLSFGINNSLAIVSAFSRLWIETKTLSESDIEREREVTVCSGCQHWTLQTMWSSYKIISKNIQKLKRTNQMKKKNYI